MFWTDFTKHVCVTFLSICCSVLFLFLFQRKRHYWRLDSKCITLFQNDTGSKYYKVSGASDWTVHMFHHLWRQTDRQLPGSLSVIIIIIIDVFWSHLGLFLPTNVLDSICENTPFNWRHWCFWKKAPPRNFKYKIFKSSFL